MKKITNEEKAKIFSLYYYRHVLVGIKDDINVPLIDTVNPCLDFHAILKPLSKITDEDAIEAIQMTVSEKYKEIKIASKDNRSVSFSFQPNRGGRIYGFLILEDLNVKSFQYLQSQGYALPYLDYSVEDLVELGVYKLK